MCRHRTYHFLLQDSSEPLTAGYVSQAYLCDSDSICNSKALRGPGSGKLIPTRLVDQAGSADTNFDGHPALRIQKVSFECFCNCVAAFIILALSSDLASDHLTDTGSSW